MRKAFYTTMFGGVVDIIQTLSNRITNGLYLPKIFSGARVTGFSVLIKTNRVINVETIGSAGMYLIKQSVVAKTIQ